MPGVYEPSFTQAALSWKTKHFESISYNTAKCYLPPYQRAVEFFADTPIKQIRPAHVKAFIGQFERRGLSHRTVKLQLLVLSMIFRWAVIDGLIEQNPAEYVSISKNLPKRERTLPPDDYIALVKNSLNAPFGLLGFALLYTGCRIGELLALQYRDIDRDAKVIHVTKSVYYVNNMPMIKKPKSKSGMRDIILLDILAQHIPCGKPDDYLFPDENGNLMTHSYFRHSWNRYCRDLGVSRVYTYTDKLGHKHSKIAPLMTPHQLRHCFATLLYEAEIDEKIAQSLLGHSSISITKDVYTHIRQNQKQKYADILNAYALGSESEQRLL